MQAFFDGSYTFKGLKGTRFGGGAKYVSWGLVFTEGEDYFEVSGFRKVSHDFGAGYHELVACVEASLWLHSHGYSPSEVSFVTDDELTVYGRHATIENGYAFRGQGDRLRLASASLVQRKIFTREAMDVCWSYLLNSRFDKVKGHAKNVYNERCDYLAKSAVRSETREDYKVMGYDEWLMQGFVRTDKEGNLCNSFAPFLANMQ